MKKALHIIVLVLFTMSCNDDMLNITPTDQLTDETVWNDPETATLFLYDIYDNLNPGPWPSIWTNRPSQVSNDPLDNYSDNSMPGPIAGITSEQLFATGSYDPSNRLFNDQWRNMYANIRKANLFIEKVTASDFDEDYKNKTIAQARFLRGYFYKQLIDLYGGVPLITKVLDRNNDESINYPRNSYEECVAFIQQEMEAVAEHLPSTVFDGGRATKGAALALKGQMELYAGKWEDAAETNWEIIQSGIYDLFADYESLFWEENENNEEVIFDVQYVSNTRGHAINTYWGVVESSDGFGWGAVNPTQNLVDAYEFKDGLTADEGSIYYDPGQPYENRDERFYASIIYDGSVWRGDTIYTRSGIPNNENGIDLSGSGNSTRTGYFLRKLLDPNVVPGRDNLDNLTGGTNVIIFRYAEVLLNYAEAKNEVSGPDQTVYDAVNKVRQRAGQPDIPGGLSQGEMRQHIRDERRIEMAFEGHRFYDLRRWRIAEEIFSDPMEGMKITEVNDQLQFERISVRPVSFDASKNYLLPVPQYAIDQNLELDQNPGYQP